MQHNTKEETHRSGEMVRHFSSRTTLFFHLPGFLFQLCFLYEIVQLEEISDATEMVIPLHLKKKHLQMCTNNTRFH